MKADWNKIFEKQRELIEKYKDIEGMGDLLEHYDNIHTKDGQKWIKDFAWRTTEELVEADEKRNRMSIVKEMVIYGEYIEELIDAVHFLTELTIIAGYDSDIIPYIPDNENPITIDMYDVIYYLGLMCNTLKNKPWKQTPVKTNVTQFEQNLVYAWSSLILLLRKERITDAYTLKYYLDKNAINNERIEHKY